MPATATDLVEALRRHRLLAAAHLQQLARLQAAYPDPRLLTKQFVQLGWLTAYQGKRLLAGQGAELVLGPYVILEKLGEGSNGRVFKARHQALERVTALKVLRAELLADVEAVGRFYREIEVVSQISHPNIVHAYDAGPIGGSLVLAMEYIEGVDLERLVAASGPVPVAPACAYIQEAALGLQHAHDNGLVHRDIKPSNLLLRSEPQNDSKQRHGTVPAGIVKIVDLGLARLQAPTLNSQTANLTVLTGEALTQGTPDYMAPEQALDFHGAGVPADIYSLGCTFYYLLTGQPPFPTGSLADKLLAHQQAEPQAMGELARQLPPQVLAILRKMLAKDPRSRYPSAGQAADALARTGAGRSSDSTLKLPRGLGTSRGLLTPAGSQPAPGHRGRRKAAYFAFALVLAGLIALVTALRPGSPPPAEGKVDAMPVSPTAPSVVGGDHGSLVVVASVSTHKRYDIMTAQVGETYWIDRVYKITALSPGLAGAVLVRGANEDKNVASASHLTLTLGTPATVYVAYDRRATKLPAWLRDGTWQLTEETLSASGGDAQASPWRVYARRFPAGAVTLGGNKQPPAAGAGSNYVVMVKP